MAAIRIILADDHEMVRQGLRTLLGHDPDLAVVGEAETGLEAVVLAHALQPDVVLMDLAMPELDGLAATRRIRAEVPGTEVLALTSTLDLATVQAVIAAGAIGYLLKDTRAAALRQAIHAAAAGQVQLAPAVRALLLQTTPPAPPVALTAREITVLRLLATGQANKEIAHALDLADSTVKAYVHTILSKIGVSSRTQAALYAVQQGLLPPADRPPRPANSPSAALLPQMVKQNPIL